MALQRSNTRFSLSSLRTAPPKVTNRSTKTRPARKVSNSDPLKKLKKRGAASPNAEPPAKKWRIAQDTSEEVASTGLRELHIPQVVESGLGVIDYVVTEHGSPWEDLKLQFKMTLNDTLIVASRNDKSLVAVRSFSGPDAKRKVNVIRRIQYRKKHKNFVVLLGCFNFEDSFYIVLEHNIKEKETLLITLSQFALAEPYLGETKLAAILGQISLP